MSQLAFAKENHAARLETALASIRREQHPAAYVMATICHRVLGTCAVLMDSDVAACRDHLRSAGRLRLDFLRLAAGRKTDERYLCCSKDMGFAASVAAGDWDTAKEIARLSSKSHFASVEYEDDFLFFFFLHSLLLDHDNRAALDAVLARWLAVLEGADSGSFTACRAIHERTAEFDIPFAALLAYRASQLAKYAQQIDADRELLAVERGLYVEGLAVAQFAAAFGLKLKGQYPLVPAILLPHAPRLGPMQS
ncbi:MAG TPA: hypothetical protein VFO94_02710 [Gammaproteobacteria bacterium]|nr:hypothetical protein [Gammaproteobacteria bacterium]